LIDEYGEFNANEMVKNRGCNKNFYRRYSKISESFFDKLQNLMNETLFYEKNEKWIKFEGKNGFYVDLMNEKENKIIEFNGDFFHANPKLYKKNDIIKVSENFNFKAHEIWENDSIKIQKLKNLKYDVHIVWENDVKNNTNIELNKCVEFLKNNQKNE